MHDNILWFLIHYSGCPTISITDKKNSAWTFFPRSEPLSRCVDPTLYVRLETALTPLGLLRLTHLSNSSEILFRDENFPANWWQKYDRNNDRKTGEIFSLNFSPNFFFLGVVIKSKQKKQFLVRKEHGKYIIYLSTKYQGYCKSFWFLSWTKLVDKMLLFG